MVGITAKAGTPLQNRLDLPVALIERTGAASVVVTDTRPEMLVAVPARMPDPAGTITVSVPPARVHLFNAETGAALPA